MKIYRFYDTDISGEAEYDICGENYKELISCIIRHSSTFSFYRFDECINIPSWIEKYRLPINEEIRKPYCYHRIND